MTWKIDWQQSGAQRNSETGVSAVRKRRPGRVWVERRTAGRQSVYGLRWFDPWTGKRCWQTVGSNRDAAQKEAAEQRRILAAIAADPGRASWAGWVTKDLAYLACYRRPATVELAERAYDRLTEICRPGHVGAVTPAMLEQFVQVRIRQVQAATVAKEMRYLEAGLYRALDRGYLLACPFRGNRQRLYPTVIDGPIRTVSPDQFERLYAAAPRRDWRGILLLGYYGGLRAGEILALRLEDVDLEANLLWIRSRPGSPTKSGQSRAIPLAQPLGAYLAAVKAERRRTGRVIRWTSLRPERRERVRSLSSAFARLCIKAGVVNEAGRPAVSLHDLRRSAITRWIGRGMTTERLKLRAGHKNLETTLRYYAAVDERGQDKEIVEG